jgi:hypothetical protein
MKIQCRCLLQIVEGCAFAALAVVSAPAQLAPNETNGLGDNRLVTFTYLQNFDSSTKAAKAISTSRAAISKNIPSRPG